jgi:hypothetical protein
LICPFSIIQISTCKQAEAPEAVGRQMRGLARRLVYLMGWLTLLQVDGEKVFAEIE